MALALTGPLPNDVLAYVEGEGNARLTVSAALAFAAAVNEVESLYGWTPRLTSAADALRPFSVQEQIFFDRYRPYPSQVLQGGKYVVDKRTYKGIEYWRYRGAAAAVPGTGNHPKGVAVDIAYMSYGTIRTKQMHEVLGRHGWTNTEGRSIHEAWHMAHEPSLQLVNNYIITGKMPVFNDPTGNLPNPIEKGFLMSLTDKQQDEIYTWLRNVNQQVAGAEGFQPSVVHRIIGLQEAVQNVMDQINGAPSAFAAQTDAITAVKEDTWDIRLALTNALLVLIAATSRFENEPQAIAKAIAEYIPQDIAQDVVDELVERLKPSA